MEGQTTKRKRIIGPYILGKTIGEGSSAKVKIGRHKQTQEYVAIKIISKGLMSVEALERIKKEIYIAGNLQHPHIVELKEVYTTKDKIFVVMELLHGGDLFGKLVEEGAFKEQAAKRIFQQLLEALHHCHQEGIFHRDLKPENILLTGDGDVKLSDFGLASFTKHNSCESGIFTEICGTPNYLPPEVIEQNNCHGAPADVWSLGVVLYVILVGRLPFVDGSFAKLCKKIQKGLYKTPDYLSTEVQDLLKKMICPDPTQRVKIKEIFSHPWIHQNNPVLYECSLNTNLLQKP